MKSRSFLQETVRAADTPRPECRAQTSRSPSRSRRYVPPPGQLECFLPAGFQCSQKIRLPARNRAPSSAQTSDQELDRHWHRAFDPMADGRESHSLPATTRVRDSQSGCTCNSVARDCRDGTTCPRSSRGRSTRRNLCSRPPLREAASPFRPAAADGEKQPFDRKAKHRRAEEREVSGARHDEEPCPAPSGR